MKPISLLYVCLLLLIIPVIALAGEPPATPFIRINTEMHSAKIMDIATDSTNKLLATASFDKSIKIWEAETSKLIRTIRLPVGSGNEGTLNTVAISPDGKTVAAGGNTGKSWNNGFSVYIFDIQTGEMTHHLKNLPQFIQRVAYSPDGSRLAVALNNSQGVSVFRTSDYTLLWSDKIFKGDCYGMDFDRSGNLAVASDMGIIKSFRPDGTLIFNKTAEDGKKIFTIKFSPDGKHIATGYDNYNSVEVRSAEDGSVAFTLEKPKGNWANGIYSSVAWSVDGRQLLTAGRFSSPDKRKVLTRWSVSDKKPVEQMILPLKNEISKLLQLKNGSTVFVSRLSGFGLISANGGGKTVSLEWRPKKRDTYTEVAENGGGLDFYHPIATADFKLNHDFFKIADDAGAVLFSYERYGQAQASFNLKNRKIIQDRIPGSNLIAPRISGNGVDVKNWENWKTLSPPRLNNKPLKGFWNRETSVSLAVSHDDSRIVLGSNMNIRLYNTRGKLLWQKRVPGVAWDVNISRDNRTVVAALDDSTIRWYRLDDGLELYALYLHPDKKRWVFWLPDGFFDHGPESEDLIGFLVNRGSDKAAIMVGVEQMYDIFYRPDIIDRAIAGEDVSAYLPRLGSHGKSPVILKNSASAETGEQARLQAEKKRRENEAAAAEKLAREQAEKERLQQEQSAADDASFSMNEPDIVEETTDVIQNAPLAGLLNSETLPPKVRFISRSGSSISHDISIKAELCDTGGGIGSVTLFMNNTPIALEKRDRGLAARNKNHTPVCRSFERTITLAPGQNNISLTAYNKANTIESDRDQITLNYVTSDTEKPRLHILTIAVNNYRDGDLRLKYSINDAEGLIKVASDKARTLFSDVAIHRLHDEQVTKEKMEAIFTRIGATTKRGDVFLLFMAGHGLTDDSDGMYYFLPVNFRYTGQESIASQGISMNDFKRYLVNIQAMKTLLLIDTCNSGSFSEAVATRGVSDKTAISKLARTVGRATIAASSKNQVALEGYEGHGVFSYTLLEGLKGKAVNQAGEITINRLATFIEETLPELTFKKWGYEQIPQKSLIGSDFSIGAK